MEHHRHFWQFADTEDHYVCTDCAETCSMCQECGGATGDAVNSSSLLICESCIRHWRGVIDDIETAAGWYRWAPPSPVRATRYDRDVVHGQTSREESAEDWTLEDAIEVVKGWAVMWSEVRGEALRIAPGDYLRGHITWAAHNTDASAWGDWKREMRKALHVAKREAGLLPKRMPAPCAHCGGVAVRTWADRDLTPHTDGLSDEVVCLGCGLTWRSEAQYRQLSKQHIQALPEVRPDQLVTLREALTVWPDIPIKTWRTWADRGEMPDPAGWDERQQPQWRVGDLDVLARRRLDETRRGRRARTSA